MDNIVLLPAIATENGTAIARKTPLPALDARAIREGDAMAHSLALWAVVHGVVALAVMMPAEMFSSAQMQRVGEMALETHLEGLKLHA